MSDDLYAARRGPKPNDLYVGVDYGIRRVAVAVFKPSVRQIVLLDDMALSENSRDYELLALGSFVADRIGPIAPMVRTVSVEAAILGASFNASTLAGMAYTAGAIVHAAASAGCRARLVPSASWKKLAVEKGNASKADVFRWATIRFPKSNITTQDQADAIGLAVHAHLSEVES